MAAVSRPRYRHAFFFAFGLLFVLLIMNVLKPLMYFDEGEDFRRSNSVVFRDVNVSSWDKESAFLHECSVEDHRLYKKEPTIRFLKSESAAAKFSQRWFGLSLNETISAPPPPPRRVLFLTTYFLYVTMMSRWYFHLYEAAKTIDLWEVYLWGPGMPLYNSMCGCQLSPSEEVWVRCSVEGGKEGMEAPSRSKGPPEYGDDTAERKEVVVSPESRRKCYKVRAMTFAEQLRYVFGERPFDVIFFNWHFGVRDRNIYFKGLPKSTLLIFYEHEWHHRSPDIVKKMQPDIVVFPYVDQFEENYFVRQFVRSLTSRDYPYINWFTSNSPSPDKQLRPYREVGPNYLAAYAPLGILPQCHSVGVEKRIGSEDTLHRPLDFLIVGGDSRVYPTRAIMRAINLVNNEMGGRMYDLRHPGYVELTSYFNPIEGRRILVDRVLEYQRYLSLMERAKICFIGGISTWSIRKYKEAMASGCLVVGDVPADFHLAPYIINLNLTLPAWANPFESLDEAAVANAHCEGSKTCSLLMALTKETEEAEKAAASYVPVVSDSQRKGDRIFSINTHAQRLLLPLKQILQKLNQGHYDDLIEKARQVALNEYSWQAILMDWIEPAISARQGGMSGWLRLPQYLLENGRKYRTRHRYLLTEWLLESVQVDKVRRKLMDDEMGKISFHDLVQLALHVRSFVKENNYGPWVLSRKPSFGFDFGPWEVSFLRHRKLYSQSTALDHFSHHSSEYLSALY